MLFTYWEGIKTPYINLCHKALKQHNPEFVVLTPESIRSEGLLPDLIDDPFYSSLMPAHRADLIRIRYLERGGMWIDSDFIPMHSFDNIISASNRQHKLFYYSDDFQPTNGILSAPPAHSAVLEWSWKNTIVFANLKRMNKVPTTSDGWCSFGANQLAVVLRNSIDPCQDLTRERVQPIAYNDMHKYFDYNDVKSAAWPAAYGYMLFNTGFPLWFKGKTEEEILTGTTLISYLFRLSLRLEKH